MAIYMKIDGINGNVSAKGHENWIELQSVNFGASRHIHSNTGHAFDREASKPTFHNITISKYSDISSSDLFTKMCEGKSISQIQIDVCHTDQELSPHLQYTLHNVIISQISDVVTKSSGNPLENLSLNFTKIEKKFTPRNSQNQSQAPKSAGYDLETAQMM